MTLVKDRDVDITPDFALDVFKAFVDVWFNYMDDHTQLKALSVVRDKMGIERSSV